MEIPLTAICAYDQKGVAIEGGVELLLDLLKSNSIAILMGPKAGLVKMV